MIKVVCFGFAAKLLKDILYVGTVKFFTDFSDIQEKIEIVSQFIDKLRLRDELADEVGNTSGFNPNPMC